MKAEILLGTQGWSYPDWVGPFYPPGSKPKDFLRLYSQSLNTVEIDSSFYGTPRPSMIESWRQSTPEGFRFAAKLPQAITHEKRLVEVDRELEEFLGVMRGLEERLGVLLAQLPPDFRHGEAEQEALASMLARWPSDVPLAVEFRHRSWARPEIFELLRDHLAAWCINELYYLPAKVEVTADFTYVRWLGDHRKIERFGEVQVDRTSETSRWAATLAELSNYVTKVYGYYNNHYAGHSPASVRLLQRNLNLPESSPPVEGVQRPLELFDSP